MKSDKLATSLWIHLAKCYGRILQRVRRIESRAGLTLPQLDVLAQLLRHPNGMTAGELSRALLVTAGNLTGIADRLEERRLVARKPHPEDGRVSILRLTARGSRVARTEIARHERALDPIFASVKPRVRVRVRSALQHLWHALEER